MTPAIVYRHGSALYLNLTNRCPVRCSFCLKARGRFRFGGRDLRHDSEPSAEEVVAAARREIGAHRPSEAVFCGLGEPTVRLPELLTAAAALRRSHPALRMRLNTIGLGSRLWGRDVAADLAGLLDAVRVSLNTADPAQWRRLHRPRADVGPDGFGAVLQFIERCVGAGLETTVSAVVLPRVDLERVRALALGLGASVIFRPRLPSQTPGGPSTGSPARRQASRPPVSS